MVMEFAHMNGHWKAYDNKIKLCKIKKIMKIYTLAKILFQQMNGMLTYIYCDSQYIYQRYHG